MTTNKLVEYFEQVLHFVLGSNSAFLFYYCSYHNAMTNTLDKMRRWSAWESNPGPQDGKQRQIPWVMVALKGLKILLRINFSPLRNQVEWNCIKKRFENNGLKIIESEKENLFKQNFKQMFSNRIKMLKIKLQFQTEVKRSHD